MNTENEICILAFRVIRESMILCCFMEKMVHAVVDNFEAKYVKLALECCTPMTKHYI